MYDLFADFFNSFDVVPVYREDRRCENCGKTYYEFQKSGRLGCSQCYKAFGEQVRQALYKVQKGTEHKGKIPSKSSAEILKKRQLADLKARLAKAVSAEDYESAAKLHKEIKGLEG